jgi:hypothetical protein
MNMSIESKARAVRLQHAIKWLVYALLCVNFGGYIIEDWHAMLYGMPEQPDWLDWAGNFATSLDTLAWLGLLGLFEYETHFMSDHASRVKVYTTWFARFLCYLVLIHTYYAYTMNYLDLKAATPLPDMANLCAFAGQEVYYLWDLIYTEVTAGNCEQLGQGPSWFQLLDQEAVTDRAGLAREVELAIIDLVEIMCWLCIMAMLELNVQLQERGVTSGRLLINSQRLKVLAYLGLFGLSISWALTSHWLYVWDTFLWVAGFFAIEMNMSEWRDEIREDESQQA